MVTCMNLAATSLKPLCSKRLMISPHSPLWTPSGLTAMKVRSMFTAGRLQTPTKKKKKKHVRTQIINMLFVQCFLSVWATSVFHGWLILWTNMTIDRVSPHRRSWTHEWPRSLWTLKDDSASWRRTKPRRSLMSLLLAVHEKPSSAGGHSDGSGYN